MHSKNYGLYAVALAIVVVGAIALGAPMATIAVVGIAVLCPLMMMLMMGNMGGMHGGEKHDRSQDQHEHNHPTDR